MSFPELSRDTCWGRGHKFARCQTTLVSAHQEPVTTTAAECLRCKQIDSLSAQARRQWIPVFEPVLLPQLANEICLEHFRGQNVYLTHFEN